MMWQTRQRICVSRCVCVHLISERHAIALFRYLSCVSRADGMDDLPHIWELDGGINCRLSCRVSSFDVVRVTAFFTRSLC